MQLSITDPKSWPRECLNCGGVIHRILGEPYGFDGRGACTSCGVVRTIPPENELMDLAVPKDAAFITEFINICSRPNSREQKHSTVQSITTAR